MNIIIDGYNLMYCMKLKGDSSQKKRENLINELQQFYNVNHRNIIIIFDGYTNVSEHKSMEKTGDIKIVYSAGKQTADDVIIDMIKNIKTKAKNTLLITSDRKLKDFASANGIKTMDSGSFAEYFE
ncbi:MAG TPA: NYN domain-containing protein [Candidatus Goldiibacteriota bacterium]|nr:NYN domain-containing protein [Candidatus Goldiibacteriota bacterium]